jgi:hypothetical protein
MPFQVSPGVNVSEIDLTTVVPAVSTTEGAVAGVFRWGPVNKRVLVDSEATLVNRFGRPTTYNAETFFTAANFLAYGNKLYVVRAGKTDQNTQIAEVSSVTANDTHTSVELTGPHASVGIVPGSILLHSTSKNTFTVAIANSSAANTIVFTGNLSSSFTAADILIAPDSEAIYTAVAANSTALNVSTYEAATIINEDDLTDNTFVAGSPVKFAAKYPGAIGNSLKISVCDTTKAFLNEIPLNPANTTNISVNGALTFVKATTGSANIVVNITNTPVGAPLDANAQIHVVRDQLQVGDLIEVGNSTIGTQVLKIKSIGAVSNTGNATIQTAQFTIETETKYTLFANTDGANSANVQALTSGYVKKYWEYAFSVDGAPGTSNYVANFGNTSAKDEVHVVIADEDGAISGTPGTILEVFQGLSRATDAKTEDGASLYVKDVINNGSQYVYYGNDIASDYTTSALNMASLTTNLAHTYSFVGGFDGKGEGDVPISALSAGYDLFKSADDVDVSLILQGKARGANANHFAQLANYLIDNIAEVRKDCVVFVSPDKADVVQNINADEADDVVQFRNNLSSTSYAVLDSGYKYQYDKYNDVYRYVPLNGDVAGLCVRTDDTRDPWYSPAGFNRGIIKNTIKLAFNPGKAQRDVLYKSGVNPVVTFPGQGTLLFGDKTLLAKPSAFDRINVRRLFIVLEKAIATAAKFTLFEFNDEFTRSQFRNLVEPFLRDVQGRRGIYDFRVVCDETNNTPEVIDRNEFVGDIYIKPAKSINFIQLNFVAVRTGVEFSEIVGQF